MAIWGFLVQELKKNITFGCLVSWSRTLLSLSTFLAVVLLKEGEMNCVFSKLSVNKDLNKGACDFCTWDFFTNWMWWLLDFKFLGVGSPGAACSSWRISLTRDVAWGTKPPEQPVCFVEDSRTSVRDEGPPGCSSGILASNVNRVVASCCPVDLEIISLGFAYARQALCH